MVGKLRRRLGHISFFNNSDCIVVVRSGHVKQFDYHSEELISKYKDTARAIVYVHDEYHLDIVRRGFKKVIFESVGQWGSSKIRPDYWDATRKMLKQLEGENNV